MRVGAVEIGGTHVTGAIVALEDGRIDASKRLAFEPDATRPALMQAIVEAACIVQDVDRVGVAAPGPFDYERGIVRISGLGKLDALHGVDLRASLAETLSLDPAAICFLNDAEAFALGEVWLGAARGCRRAIAITLGTGFGSAFLEAETVLRDGEGVPPGGVFYPLQFRGGPVEDRISRRGILQGYGAGPEVDVIDLAARARAGEDDAARAVFRRLGEDLAEFLAPWVTEFEPSRVVVGGSIAHAWELFAEPLALLGPGLAVPAENLDDAPMLGAARYAVR